MRRLLRWCFNGLCLLSLLGCVGVAWLWWRGRKTGVGRIEVAALGNGVLIFSRPGGLTVARVGHWPGGSGVRAGEDAFPLISSPYGRAPWLDPRRLRLGPFRFVSGQCMVWLRPDGSPERRRVDEWLAVLRGEGAMRVSGPLPYWEAGRAPQWLVTALCTLHPVLWVALRSRRLHLKSRRRRRGLCLRCGYDLTGNTSGQCSEYGAAVQAGGKIAT